MHLLTPRMRIGEDNGIRTRGLLLGKQALDQPSSVLVETTAGIEPALWRLQLHALPLGYVVVAEAEGVELSGP